MLKIAILIAFFGCFASPSLIWNSEVPTSVQVNGIKEEQIPLRDIDIPPTPNDTENVLYKIGNRVPGDRLLLWGYSDLPEDLHVTERKNRIRFPDEGNSTCLLTALELLLGQIPHAEQSFRILEGGIGQRSFGFEYEYRNMVRSFSYVKLFGSCGN